MSGLRSSRLSTGSSLFGTTKETLNAEDVLIKLFNEAPSEPALYVMVSRHPFKNTVLDRHKDKSSTATLAWYLNYGLESR